jgi:nucleotidyltransferase substrate binding protein (TIGR01987 family)
MTNTNDIRWKQRFQNFEKAYQLLERTIKIEKLSEAERGGLIQFYEMSIELSWKLLKDYLAKDGFMIKSPREAIKQAFQSEIITDGRTWLEALESRNLTSHIYDEETALKVVKEIKEKYFPIITQLYISLKSKIEE